MRLIFISEKNAKRSRISFATDLTTLFLSVLVLCMISATLGYWFTKQTVKTTLITDDQLTSAMKQPLEEIASIREKSQSRLDSYSAYVANIQARLIRLDAMGERLTGLAGINDEFDFSESVGLGGAEEGAGNGKDAFAQPTFMQELDRLSSKIATREKQLEVLEHLIVKRTISKENYIAGYPVKNAYITSKYGVRIDPITGRSRGHKGVDFGGPRGSDIHSVAAGVVTFSGVKNGYGNIVEISHMDGYKTIYGHNQKNLVKAGDLVQQGQVIAKLGSTGRSTGPHVHFEVVKNGKAINPMTYITRVAKPDNSPIQMAKAE